MAGSDRSPLYLSPRSADVVLSEIRPTKLAPDALRSVNVLLDELLWMILSTARSFATDQLKVAWTKLLPSSLGKEALLEAEVELRAYWDRTTNAPSRPYAENSQEFPIQPAFELMRLKCEAYSTFNDTDDDTDAEKRWQAKVTGTNGFATHNVQYIAASALYLTAILEHVCEHVLSNTGRVASRDSSRSTATLQDLFLALCEDDAIYGLFKIMKVHNQIESQCNASGGNRLGRSKSIQRSASDVLKAASQTNGSPYGSASAVNGDTAKPRVSSESTGSGTAVATLQSAAPRSSAEKSKAKKLFGRMSMDKDAGSQTGHNAVEAGHQRSASIISTGKRSSSALDDPGSSPSEVEFDELMRSGTTMKVSLTPDRLRTFDVYSKEKGRGVTRVVIPPSTAHQGSKRGPLQDSSATNLATVGSAGQITKNGTGPSQMEVVQELEIKDAVDGEDLNGMRTRKQSKGAPPVSYDLPPHSRARSTSAAQTPVVPNGTRHAGGRKGSLSAVPVESIHSQSLRGVVSSSSHQPPKTSGSMPSNTYAGRRGHQTNGHDSIDDDMYGSSDEDAPLKKSTTRRRAPTVGGVTAQTADLIDFLNSGPPDLPKSMGPPSITSSSLDNKMKRGRLRSIVSRLKGGQSMDKLSSQSSFEDFRVGKRSPAHPPPSFVPPPLSAKRSLISLSSFTQSQLSLSKAPPVPPVTIPLSPPLSPSHSYGDPISPARPRPSPTTLRKAVPVFTDPEPAQYANGEVSLSASKPTDVSPPTPSKFEDDNHVMKAQQMKDADEGRVSNATSSSVTPAAHKTSDALRTPPPSNSSMRPSQKQSQRHAMSPPTAPKAFASHAVDLRRLMANATSADECRLLVDMFLAQSGLPMKDADFPADPKILPSAQQESAIVEALLGFGEALAEDHEEPVKNGVATLESNSPPTPRSDDHHTPTVYRKPATNDHAVRVVTAEA